MERATYGHRAKAALRNARERAGLSQEQLADLLSERGWRKFNQGNIWRYENEGHALPLADVYVLWMETCQLARDHAAEPRSA